MPLVKLSQEDLYRLVIPVPEAYVRYIRIGDPVNVQVPALNRTFPGKVARFSTDVTASTRTMHTEVDVANPEGVLLPGVYAEATLALDRKGGALVAPLQAINQSSDQAKVLVVNPSGQLEERDVTLGIQTDTDAEILSGLQEGDRVVIGDRGGLRPGETVHPQLTQGAAYKGQS
jgi:RND family efflux transporter MFP subunit